MASHIYNNKTHKGSLMPFPEMCWCSFCSLSAQGQRTVTFLLCHPSLSIFASSHFIGSDHRHDLWLQPRLLVFPPLTLTPFPRNRFRVMKVRSVGKSIFTFGPKIQSLQWKQLWDNLPPLLPVTSVSRWSKLHVRESAIIHFQNIERLVHSRLRNFQVSDFGIMSIRVDCETQLICILPVFVIILVSRPLKPVLVLIKWN